MKKIAIFFLLVRCTTLNAQTDEQELSKIILEKDSLFWKGYNNCDTALNGQFIADDIEFYHDKGGITHGKQALQTSLKNNLCANADRRLRREAVPGTVKVYPMHTNDTIYGAILLGEHYFYITEKGRPEVRTGHASFTHLWLKKNGRWKMTRVLSYDHGHPDKGMQRKAIVLPPKALEQFAGSYKGPQTNKLIIQQQTGNLVMIVNNNKMTLYPDTPNTFFIKERDLSFEFILDAKKQVTGLRIREQGAVAEELTLVK